MIEEVYATEGRQTTWKTTWLGFNHCRSLPNLATDVFLMVGAGKIKYSRPPSTPAHGSVIALSVRPARPSPGSSYLDSRVSGFAESDVFFGFIVVFTVGRGVVN